MKRLLTVLIVAFVFMLIFSCKGKESSTTAQKSSEKATTRAIDTTPEKPTEGLTDSRAVSLKVLQRRAEDCMAKGDCPQHILHLVGIKKIMGYIIDEENSDLILIGKTDATSPPLYLENFVIALRNAWLLYAPLKGNTYYYSAPGCSIDPNPQILLQLQQLHRQILNTSTPQGIQRYLSQWHNVCQKPQQVRVLGIPFDTRFAKVTVEADYFMKRLVDGSAALDIDGFTSLTDMTLHIVQEDLNKGMSVSIPAQSMNRFWFFPGENSFLEGRGIIYIQKSEVKLLTEEEYLTQKGEIAGTGRPDSLAGEFADGFSERYAEIAQKKSIYAELEGLFRFVALAKVLKYKDGPSEAGISLDYLLHQYPVGHTPVSRTLPGIAQIKDIQQKTEIPGGYRVAYLWLPSCGGVSIDIRISKEIFKADETGKLEKLREDVLKARPAPDALYWDFPSMWIVRVWYKHFVSSGYKPMIYHPGDVIKTLRTGNTFFVEKLCGMGGKESGRGIFRQKLYK